jgi:hypothetical protein
MEEYLKYGRLLSAEEAKKVRGGKIAGMFCMVDDDCPGESMCFDGVCGGGVPGNVFCACDSNGPNIPFVASWTAYYANTDDMGKAISMKCKTGGACRPI